MGYACARVGVSEKFTWAFVHEPVRARARKGMAIDITRAFTPIKVLK